MLVGKSTVTVTAATPGDRTAMIPLLVSPHDFCVLDANVGIFSTQYELQSSCMGLYPRYQKLREDGRGEWFAARANDGRVVGLSTVRLDSDGAARLDGFAHHCHADSQDLLISQAAHWAAGHAASVLEAIIAVTDQQKLAGFEALGFRNTGVATPLNLDGQNIHTVRLEKSLADHHTRRADFPHQLHEPHQEQVVSDVDAEKV